MATVAVRLAGDIMISGFTNSTHSCKVRRMEMEQELEVRRLEMEQELEWKEAQKIVINVDLVAAAKRQLKFLAAVDRNRWLYEGPALEMTIYRYNVYWLPLLAKHSESPLFEGPLVVPLDCEWVWHCHRLNPLRYKSDCMELYGTILDNHSVVSSVEGASKEETEQAWKMVYPDEPYEMDSTRALSNNISDQLSGVEKCTKYDLVNAVKRQICFFYQVDRPHMSNDLYLEGAVARYKGFLHLIKRNNGKSKRRFNPTFDIDLIWHTHQLYHSSYCKDLVNIMGMVLQHDDTEAVRKKGMKMDTGVFETTKLWEEVFGLRYWRAGAMHRGEAPSPLRTTPYPYLSLEKENYASKQSQKITDLPKTEAIEVMLEFVSVKNVPEEHKGMLSVSFSKIQPNSIFNAKRRRLTILSESGEKQVSYFQCHPSGNLIFELVSHSTSNLGMQKPEKVIASGSILLEDVLSPMFNLTMEKWLEMVPSSTLRNSKPICLRVAISVTVPTPAPNTLHMISSQPFSKGGADCGSGCQDDPKAKSDMMGGADCGSGCPDDPPPNDESDVMGGADCGSGCRDDRPPNDESDMM